MGGVSEANVRKQENMDNSHTTQSLEQRVQDLQIQTPESKQQKAEGVEEIETPKEQTTQKNEANPQPESTQTSKSEDPFSGLSFSVGVAENKNSNYRDKMEDVHTYVANYAEKLDWGYFAIFDGHAGKQTARWCGNNLHALVEEEILALEASSKEYDLRHVLHNAFRQADEALDKDGSGSSGSTAAVAILGWEAEGTPETSEGPKAGKTPPVSADARDAGASGFDFVPSASHRRMLYTANVGDSRIVLCRGDKSYRLSYDHKASDASESERIREVGGLIVKNRVNGVFAITRALGDSYIKNLVTGAPFTTATEILPEDEFLILACDGVWDVLSDVQACRYVQKVFRQQLEDSGVYDPKAAAKKLCNLALENASTDNITVMVVLLDAGVFHEIE